MSDRTGRRAVRRGIVPGVLLLCLLLPATLRAQQIIGQSQETIRLVRGQARMIQLPVASRRVIMGDPTIFNVEVPAPNELIITALAVGTTNLILGLVDGSSRSYNIEVAADIGPLQDQIRTLFPNENITVTTSGNAVILSGAVRDPAVVRRVLQLAQAVGAPIINNIQAPTAEQILLHVRFGEIAKSALSRLAADLTFRDLGLFETVFREGQRTDLTTLAEGIVQLFLSRDGAGFDAFIRALRSNGEFRALAEPNLLALEGQEATFLAGGEFPYPTVQAAAGTGVQSAVSITFKEFGVRLRFTPNVTPSGTIRLRVAPEVSALDFANGLTISGFAVPTVLTRRAETTVELAPGQHLAIAGLLDNRMSENVDKIPLLGDLPVLGALFRSREHQQDRTELLVLVTPYIIEPSNTPLPVAPGEPSTWKWDSRMRPDTVNRTMPQVRRGGGR